MKSAEQRQVTALVGLRRTGKTTLLYQCINHLLERDVPQKTILYFSFDEQIEELDSLLILYEEQILKRSIEQSKVYLFLDEIQKLKDWQNQLKILYDLHPGTKIFVSGSASLDIFIKGKESLAGRTFYFHLDLLSFREFLRFRGVEPTDDLVLWEKELRIELNDYLLKPFPEIVHADDDTARRYICEGIIDGVIYKDLRQLFDVRELELLEKLLHILADNPGMIVNLGDLSKDLGRSRQMISNYLHYLQCCFIVKGLRNFRGSLKVSSRKLKRYYLAHPSLALALSSPEQGKLMENLVLFKTGADLFWRDGDKEVDFVIAAERILPIEVKYRKTARKKDLAGLLSFMKRFRLREGVVITENREGEEHVRGKRITYRPLWKWLLEQSESNLQQK